MAKEHPGGLYEHLLAEKEEEERRRSRGTEAVDTLPGGLYGRILAEEQDPRHRSAPQTDGLSREAAPAASVQPTACAT